MPLTPTQIAKYVNLKAEEAKKQLEIDNIVYISPADLEATKGTEIAIKRTAIKTHRKNYSTNPIGGRNKYVADVQPMKDALRVLQAENENVKNRNKAKEDEARKAHNDKLAPLQAELETIQANIKTFLAGI